MNNFKTYADKAKKNTIITTDTTLALCIGIRPGSFSQLMRGKTLPTDSTILKLAALAGIPPEVALIDVSIWRNKNNPEALRFWENIRAKIAPEN